VGEGDGRHAIDALHGTASPVRQTTHGESTIVFQSAVYGKRPDGATASLGMFAQNGPHGTEEDLVDVIRDLGPGLHREREFTVEDTALGSGYVDGPEQSLVIWYLRDQGTLEGVHG